MMTKAKALLLISAALAYPLSSLADAEASQRSTLTAVCKSPTGITMTANPKSQTEADGFGDGLFIYTWKLGDSSATIVSQSGAAAGNTPATEPATAVTSAAGFVTFLVFYERAVWTHSLFIDKKTVLISRHVDSLATQGPVGGLYKASCSLALQ